LPAQLLQHRAQRHSARGRSAQPGQPTARAAGERTARTKIVILNRIVRDPEICDGQPIIRGTRVSVRLVLAYLAQGETMSAILRELPTLTVDDVRTVIAFAAAWVSEELPAPAPFRWM
jgi:uncharacterized protein (DUF433 family)